MLNYDMLYKMRYIFLDMMQSAVPACFIVFLTASSGCLSTNAYPSTIRHHHQRNLANYAPSLSQDLADDTYEDGMNSIRPQVFNTRNGGGELNEDIKAQQNQNTVSTAVKQTYQL